MAGPSLEIKYVLVELGDEVYQDLRLIPTGGLAELEFQVTIGIGEIDRPGADDFSLCCLCNMKRKKSVPAAPANTAVKRFDHLDMGRVDAWIRDRVRKCDKGTYEASLPNLRLVFDWEFEGCKPLVSR
ncbi:Imm8 family immunity protein [Labrenzia sp. VG12]|uniref:Imm8 family immunity protein n=1 Tax=Labrenzia sp. VG12 TaxID=2021862 RepID=UPI000B8C32F6|nr:Imm8 family immunity protein [Labrenzia sp. VG12]ASP35540.1 hypothetical protein CHH27_21765 [Labrenzia sp. VG12]